MILVLQTTITGRITVWLVHEKKIQDQQELSVVWHGSDKALAFIDSVLRKNKISIPRLSQIIVVRGPGSFTAVRTGLIVANTLAAVLRIPAQGIVTEQQLTLQQVVRAAQKKGVKNRMVKPWYGKSPNITRAKPIRRQARARR